MKVLPTLKGKKSPPMTFLPKSWAKRLPSLNQTALKRRKGAVTQITCAFPSLIHDITLTFISPMVPNDYSPPPVGYVWLSICYRDTEVSWAHLASTIPDLDIRLGTSLPIAILFKFGSGAFLGWKEWVDKELSNTSFMVEL